MTTLLKYNLSFLFFCLFQSLLPAQEAIIQIHDTCRSSEAIQLDPIALHRRAVNSVDYPLSIDYPVQASILSELTTIAHQSLQYSRWFNQAYLEHAELANLNQLSQHPCVNNITYPSFQGNQVSAISEVEIVEMSNELNARAKYQTARLGKQEFDLTGIDGTGVRIAVFDAGFPQVDKHPAFNHIRKNGAILSTYHFLKGKADVFNSNAHGRMVLSNIAGIAENGTHLGLAPNAQFLLAITENSIREYYGELQAWVMAAEWAEQNGAHIISSSLGYQVDQSPKSIITLAAERAADLGILVINSAGNNGNGWNTISAPADANGILTIGATNPATDAVTNFSSSGPIVNQQLKPEICAPGINTVANASSYTVAQGTSFSCPLISGFAACVLQHFDLSVPVQDIRQIIMSSAHLYPYYDYAHGFGIPQASYILKQEHELNTKVPFEASINSTTEELSIQIQHTDALYSYSGTRNLFYKVSLENENTILKYGLIQYQLEDKEKNLEKVSVQLDTPNNQKGVYLVELFFEGNYSNQPIQVK